MPEKPRELSLLPIDVGFDLRNTGHSIRLYEGFVYKYLNQKNKKMDVGPPMGLVSMAELLALSGYCVVPFIDPLGQDVVVVPSGIREEEGKIVWNVMSQYGLKWYTGDTLQEVLANLEWKIDDLQPLSSDEYA